MIVACSNCFKRFNVEDSLIPPQGRLVQCSVCSCTWQQLPEESIAVNTPSAETPPNTSSIPAPQSYFKQITLTLFLTCTLLFLAFLVVGRNILIQLWPEAEYGYEAANIPTQNVPAGLTVSNLTPQALLQNGMELLIITGTVKNLSPFPRKLNSLLFQVRSTPDSQGNTKILESWEHPLPPTILAPGAVLALKTNPRINPSGSGSVTVEFFYDPLTF